ncbi:MAG TPA: serine/threonine-protein kinase [Pyrinomonadaceae bacterium]|nr:serine/threonine-protein kinase [Pyrinomonadaceae bacterium]
MIEPNTLLQNRYRVVKQIGQGGMGAVYIATDERFGSTVAVKQTFFDDPTLRKAFEREAHLLNHLRHTALPKVSDHFTEDEGQFLVMEFIEGSDLSELLQQRGGAFPIAEVLAWADELLDALEYLHTQQPPVVHRDIKPQNMKLTTRGHIALLDFGLAKGTPAQTRTNATAASVFGYSRNYAPLEQIQGTGTDTRSDLYSLSATLYHLLTGKAPVDALTRASAIVNGQPDPLRPAHVVHAQVPAPVGEILKRAMSQNAAHRQATAAEMRAALRRAAAALPNTARQAGAAFTKPSTDMATLLEPTTQAAYGQQSPTGTRATTQVRPPNAALLSETTITDAQAARRPRPSMNSFVPPSYDEPPAQKSTAKLIGVALAVVAACALIAFPLMRRDNATPATELKIETPRDAPADATQSAAPDATQFNAARENPNTSSASDTTSTQTQSRAARETPATANQSTAGDTETTSVPDVKDGGSSATGNESGNASPSVGASANRSQGLVLQGPNPQSGVRNTAAAEYDAQRAEELKRRQQQQQQRPSHPQPDEGHFGPPPPHHDGRRPPPRRPPPFP